METHYDKGGTFDKSFWDNLNISNRTLSAYGKSLKEYGNTFNEISDKSKSASIGLENFNKHIVATGGEALNFKSIGESMLDGAKSIGKKALSATGNIIFDVAVSAILNKAGEAWDNYSNKQEDAIKRGTEALESYRQTNQNMQSATLWIKDNKERFEELSKGATSLGEQGTLTDQEYAEYNDLSSQLAGYLPNNVKGYNFLGTPIIDNANKIEDSLSTEKLQQYQTEVNNASDVIGKFKAEMYQDKGVTKETGITNQMEAIESYLDGYKSGKLQDAVENVTGGWFGSPTDKYGGLYTQNLNLLDAMEKAGIKGNGPFGSFINTDYTSKDNYESMLAYYNQLKTQAETSASAIRDVMPAFFQANKDYQKLTDENSTLDTMVGSLVNALDLNGIEQIAGQGEDLSTLEPESIEKNIRDWSNKFVNSLDKKETQQALSDLFTLDDKKADMSYSEYEKAATDAIKAVRKETDAFTESQLKNGSGVHDSLDQMKTDYNDIVSRFEGDKNFPGENLKTDISSSELSSLAEIANNDSFTGDYSEALAQIKYVQRQAEISLSAMQKNVTDAQTNLSSFQSAINESASATGLSAESITAVGNAFSEFSELNPALLFMNTANGVKVNNKALSSLISLQHKVKSKDFSDAIKNQTQAIAEQNEVVKNASEDNLAEEQGKLQKMFGDLSAIQQARSQYNALYQEQQKLFSDYGEWITATSTENAGDPFLNMVSGLEQAKAAYDKGLVGTDEFKSFAKLISPTGATDAANFMENYGKAARYLTEDISGVQNFLSDLQTKGMAEFNAEAQQWTYNVGNMAEAAKKMGMNEEFMNLMFGRVEDFGGYNNTVTDTEDGILKLSDAYRNLAESQVRLDRLQKEDPGNTTAIQAAENDVELYRNNIEELSSNLSGVVADSATEYAKEVKDAKEQIKILGKEYENLFKDNSFGEEQDSVAQMLEDQITDLAEAFNIDLSKILDFDELRQNGKESGENYRESLKNASIENPAEIDFGDDTEKANTYASALGKVQQANKDNKTVIEETKNALSDFTSEQIKSIDLFDGAYDSDQLEPAEKALDSLVKSLGLTNEEAEMLPQLLEATGMIKPEVDTSDIEKVATEGENAQKSLEEATGKTYDFDFNTTDLDTIQKQMDTVTNDMAQYQTTDANGNVTYDYSQPGAKETAKVYESTVRQQQAAEFSNTQLGKNEATGGALDAAVRKYQEAKNELDTQTLLAQQGVANDLERATKACNEAFQEVKDAGGEEIFDTTGIQELDDSIKNMTDKEYKAMVDVDADTSQAESKMDSATNKELQTKINTVVENGTSVDELLAMDNKTLATTVGCEDSEVQQVRAELEEMDQQNVQCAVEIDNTQFHALIEAIKGEPVTQEVQVKPTGESSITDEIEKAPSEKEVSIVGKVASLNLNGNYPPVALEGNVTNINTTGDYQSLALEGNIVQVSGGDGESIDVVGNVTSVSPVSNLSVNVVGNITSTTGGENQGGNVSLIVDSSAVDEYKPSDKNAKVKFSKDSSEPDNYQPSDKSATVTYNVDATNVLAYDPPNKSATVTYTVQTIGSPPKGGAVSCASGTMISPAHANGTAYNVLNMHPISSAHADGDVALKHNEKSLVNEVGMKNAAIFFI